MQEQSSSKLYCFIISCFLAAGSRVPGALLLGGREPGALLLGRPAAGSRGPLMVKSQGGGYAAHYAYEPGPSYLFATHHRYRTHHSAIATQRGHTTEVDMRCGKR